MGTLVLDIETASQFEEPPEGSNDTAYFESVVVGLAYVENLDDQHVLPDWKAYDITGIDNTASGTTTTGSRTPISTASTG